MSSPEHLLDCTGYMTEELHWNIFILKNNKFREELIALFPSM
jgi:hypothetical protein